MQFEHANKARRIPIFKHSVWLVLGISLLAFLFLEVEHLETTLFSKEHEMWTSFIPESVAILLTTTSSLILTWLDFSFSLMILVIGCINFGFSRNIAPLIFGIGFFLLGTLNLVEILTIEGLLKLELPTTHTIGFAWWEDRLFFTLSLSICAFIVFIYQKIKTKSAALVVISVTIYTTLLGGGALYYLVYIRELTQMIFGQDFGNQALEYIPLFLILTVLTPSFFILFKQHPTLFRYALILSLIPNIASEAYLIYDPRPQDFGTLGFSHIMELIAIFIPLLGLHSDNRIYYVILDESKKKAEEASQAKDRFLSALSYKLRTPLTTILGLADCMLEEFDGPINMRQKSSINLINTAAKKLTLMINELIDISKIEGGRVIYNPEEVNLAQIVQLCVLSSQARAQEKDLKITQYIEDQYYITSDSTRIKQILLELIRNATKFTQQGEINVSLSTDKETLKLTVKDSGLGIATSDQERIFDPFFTLQIDDKMGGIGLGLPIAKKIAEALDGYIQLEKDTGKQGTVISLCFPKEKIHQFGDKKKIEKVMKNSVI
ncbi:MAG: HAMP domain-containing sensor histidine kinase [Rhabdochlamydiaceae bacterium]|nr:HAMP domain-containing sensor histidine kinase [Candidatus Amphrikana amoebophyrae]